MFYKIIEKKRDEWLSSPSCVIIDLISYIEHQHKMRDAQIESIKTYLFLKIECQNRPLWELFTSGKFNSTNVDDLEVNKVTREILTSNPAALALWEYASISDENGNVNSPKILANIKKTPDSIDYVSVIKDLFSNVSYPDYLFSIPMGAGKTSDFWDGTIHADTKPLRMKIRNICGDETIIKINQCFDHEN